MTKLGVTSSSAVSEPRTTATATTHFSIFLDGAAFAAHGTDGRRRDFWCVHMQTLVKPYKEKNTKTVAAWYAR